MADSNRRVPSYRPHKSGQARVTLNGRDHYLGPWNSKASKVEYDRLIGEWLTAGRGIWQSDPSDSLTIIEILVGYWEHARQHYAGRDGQSSKELDNIRYALRPLKERYGDTLARDFGPLALKALQQAMLEAGLSRPVINSRISRIKRFFRWAVSQQCCPPMVLQGLQAVMGLQFGRTEAREPLPVRAVSEEAIEATVAHLPATVADMVRLQRLVGCRPGEICSLRPSDIDRSGAIWIYRPAEHKTKHRGRERLIFIGPKAQSILRPYLLRDAGAFCFCPADSERHRKQELRANRKTKVQPSQHDRRKKRPVRRAGERYVKDAYARAISRACDRAFPPAEELSEEEAKAWRKEHRWSPNQLRHAAATEIRRRYGLEAAQVILGHSRADVTQVYAERDQGLAAKVMGEVG